MCVVPPHASTVAHHLACHLAIYLSIYPGIADHLMSYIVWQALVSSREVGEVAVMQNVLGKVSVCRHSTVGKLE